MELDIRMIAEKLLQEYNFDETLARGAQIGVKALYERIQQAARIASGEAQTTAEPSSPADETSGAESPGVGS